MAWRLRDWWGRRTARQRAVLAWGVPLLGFAALVGGAWVWHHASGVATRGESRSLFIRVGATYLASWLILLAGQRTWNLRALGLLGSIMASSALDLRLIGRVGPTPAEWERDLIQALYDVGSTLLVLGLAVWAIFGRRTNGSGPDHVPPDSRPMDALAERDLVTGMLFDRRHGERRRGWQERRVRELEAENARLRWELDQRDRLPGSVD